MPHVDKLYVNNPDGTQAQNVQQTGSNVKENNVTITNGTALSAGVDLGFQTVVGIVMPAAWTTANLTFQVSSDGTTYNDLYDNSGAEISHVVAANRFIRVNPSDWIGVRYVKVRSGTGAAPVNQAADRVIKLITKAV